MDEVTVGDVVVVGGGIVGLSCAIALRDRGLDVVLCDPGEARARASFGNAGVVSHGSIFPMSGPGLWAKLPAYLGNRDAGLRLERAHLAAVLPWLVHVLAAANAASWRRAAAALEPLTAAAYAEHVRMAARAGAGHLLTRTGWMKLYRTQAAFEGASLERAILRERGVALEVIDGAALGELEPALVRPFARAMLLPETGAVSDPGGLVEAYARLYAGLGGRTVRAAADALVPEGGRFVVRHAGGRVAAPRAVLAAGVASATIARGLGYRFAFAAERGYHRHFALRPGSPPLGRPVYDTGGAFIASPMGEGRVRILSGVEVTRPDAPADTLQIENAAREAAGTLPLGGTLDNAPWLGSRPSTPDGLPVIGRAPRHPGLTFAFGHGHIGLSTGPITGRIVAALVGGEAPPVDVAAFAPARLLRWPSIRGFIGS